MKSTWMSIGIAIALTGCGVFVPRRHAANVQSIQTLFEILADYQVTAFRDQDWCQNIAYKRGQYTNDTRSTCTYLLPGPAQPFDEPAAADFQTVARAVRRSRVALFSIQDIRYDTSGQLASATFLLKGNFNRYAYVYEPNYTTLPADIPNERTHTAVDEDWYWVWEDWN